MKLDRSVRARSEGAQSKMIRLVTPVALAACVAAAGFVLPAVSSALAEGPRAAAENPKRESPEAAAKRGPRAAARPKRLLTPKKVQNIFRAYDADHNGKVTFTEWMRMKEGPSDAARTAREKQTFAGADRNRDGVLILQEFQAWMVARGAARDGEEPRGPREGDANPRPREGAPAAKPGKEITARPN